MPKGFVNVMRKAVLGKVTKDNGTNNQGQHWVHSGAPATSPNSVILKKEFPLPGPQFPH